MKTIKQLLEQKEKLNKKFESYNYKYNFTYDYILEKQGRIEEKLIKIDYELEKLGYFIKKN